MRSPGFYLALILLPLASTAQADAPPSPLIQLSGIQLAKNLSLPQTDGSSAILGSDGTLAIGDSAKAAADGLRLSGQTLLLTAGSESAILGTLTSISDESWDGAILSAVDGSAPLANIRLVTPGQVHEITSISGTQSCSLSNSASGTQDVISFVLEKIDGYEIAFDDGSGSIRFDLAVDQPEFSRNTACAPAGG